MSTSNVLSDNITTTRYDNLFTHDKDMPLFYIGDTLTVYCVPIVMQCDFLQMKLMPYLFILRHHTGLTYIANLK